MGTRHTTMALSSTATCTAARSAPPHARMEASPGGPRLQYENPAFRLTFARLVTHYWSNGCILAENA